MTANTARTDPAIFGVLSGVGLALAALAPKAFGATWPGELRGDFERGDFGGIHGPASLWSRFVSALAPVGADSLLIL
ncbi:MAG: hypothetical protein ACREXY_13875, partial [Gammaproteobacteria bacterium]